MEAPIADLSVNFGIWIVALVGGPASPQFSGVHPARAIPLSCAKPTCLLCHSATLNPVLLSVLSLARRGQSAASPVFFWPLELRPVKDRTFSDPWQEA